jgi:hypothetical protein
MLYLTMRTLIFSLVLLFNLNTVIAQKAKKISLTNPSFEDGFSLPGQPPKGWYDCGFEGESPPDVLPAPFFAVTKEPDKGFSYLGMVTRDNYTFEAVGQKLSSTMLKHTCYSFRISVATSDSYKSISRKTGKPTNYTAPVRLLIWAGNDYCEQNELLAETSPFMHREWRKFNFTFKPKSDHSFIKFSVYYATGEATNGNILLDNASDIVPCPCIEMKQ